MKFLIMKNKILTQLLLKNIPGIILMIIITLSSSCGLFDKDLEQDKHIAAFREQISIIEDSLKKPKERINAFKNIIEEIKADEDIFNTRKKNKILIEYYFSISQEYYNLEKYDNAIDNCNIAISLDSTNASGFYNRGCIHKAAGNDSLAITDLSKAIALNTDYADAYYNRALIYEQLENHELALADYNRVIKLNPSYIADVYNNRGNVYFATELFEKAIEDYKKGLILDPTNINIYKNRAETYARIGDIEKSINDYEKVLALDSTLVDIYMKRATLYEQQKSYTNALEDYEKAIELDFRNKTGAKQEAKEAIKKLKPLLKVKENK